MTMAIGKDLQQLASTNSLQRTRCAPRCPPVSRMCHRSQSVSC